LSHTTQTQMVIRDYLTATNNSASRGFNNQTKIYEGHGKWPCCAD